MEVVRKGNRGGPVQSQGIVELPELGGNGASQEISGDIQDRHGRHKSQLGGEGASQRVIRNKSKERGKVRKGEKYAAAAAAPSTSVGCSSHGCRPADMKERSRIVLKKYPIVN